MVDQNKIAKFIIKYPEISNVKIAKRFHTSPSSVWRIRQKTLKLNFSTKRAGPHSAISFEGFDGIKEEISTHIHNRLGV